LLRDELRRLVPALDRLFHPDQFNFAFLMNLDSQVHIHVVPRYASSRRWRDRIFTDEHWGEAFGREQRPLPPAELQLLADEIRAQLACRAHAPYRRERDTLRHFGAPPLPGEQTAGQVLLTGQISVVIWPRKPG
jgi:hypothetical protein